MDLLHGSNESDLTELEGSEPGHSGSLGWGVYLTTDEEFAKVFGKHLYRAFPSVPEDLILYIDANTHDCGNSLTIMTPGSVPFTFTVIDRASGEPHRYSVLGDCEEEVRSSVLSGLLDDYEVESYEIDESDPDIRAAFYEAAPLVLADERLRDDPSEFNDDSMYESLGDDRYNELIEWLEAFVSDVQDELEEKVSEILGTEIDLSDLSQTTMDHGYSAFFIDGYARGDEFVVVDPDYLPVAVERI